MNSSIRGVSLVVASTSLSKLKAGLGTSAGTASADGCASSYASLNVY